MFYAPHKLYKVEEKVFRNEYGNPVRVEKSEVFVCNCRCDNNTTTEIKTDNGRAFVPKYHIVCPLCRVKEGDRIMVKRGNDIICTGEAVRTPSTNYYSYTEIWV